MRLIKRNSSGAIAAEAALMIPIIAGIIFCVIEFGRIYFYINGLSQIARSSASYVSTGPQYTTNELKTLTKANKIISDTNTLTLTLTPTTNSARSVGDLVTVVASIPYESIFPDFAMVFSGGAVNMWPTEITVTAINRVEVTP